MSHFYATRQLSGLVSSRGSAPRRVSRVSFNSDRRSKYRGEGEGDSPRPALLRRNATSGRTRRTDRNIQCWADVETALAELARLERQLEEIEACEREAKARVEAEAETRRAMPAAVREGLAAALERFCRKQFSRRGCLTSGQGVKSHRLVLGRVGYRQSHAVVIRSEAAALRSLAALREGRRFL